MKNFIYLFAVVFFMFSCTASDSDKENENQDSTQIVDASSIAINVEKVKEKVINWRGGAFLKEISAENGNIELLFVKDFNELKATYPMITSTEADYKKELGKEYEIDKMLTELPVKTLLKFSDALSVTVIIPFENQIHKVVVNKKDLETFVGKNLQEIDTDYTANFGDKYVFDLKGRTDFLKRFSVQ
jgi:hypothetical protein